MPGHPLVLQAFAALPEITELPEWSELELHGTSASEVASSLRALGVRVPPLPFPQPDREPWGERIPVPLDRLMEVADRLGEELPLGTWGINQHDGKGWVIARASIDLRPIIQRALGE